MAEFTHLDEKGNARMVDVGDKEVTQRTATARGRILVAAETLKAIREGGVAKGDVFSVARLAGIMAAQKTPDLIPLCHPLPLSSVAVALAAAPAMENAIKLPAPCSVTPGPAGEPGAPRPRRAYCPPTGRHRRGPARGSADRLCSRGGSGRRHRS